MRLHMAPMSKADLEEVIQLEERAFTSPWTRNMYLRELEKGEGCYIICRCDGILLGYGGVLVIMDEAHVMTLAVGEDYRRRGMAMCMLLELMSRAESKGARFLTLEVRKSNQAAIALYSRAGFQIMGERKHYYIDNLENALIMWTEDISTPEYRELKRELRERYSHDAEAR
jgi:ribosomal-protein-alanine N-acetyltransferase